MLHLRTLSFDIILIVSVKVSLMSLIIANLTPNELQRGDGLVRSETGHYRRILMAHFDCIVCFRLIL